MNDLPQTIADLIPWDRNPRGITDNAAQGLRNSIEEFGDLSAIVFNRRNGQLIGGHQRRHQLGELFGDDTPIADLSGPDDAGDHWGKLTDNNGRQWPVRVVDWDDARHAAANISANNTAIFGEFNEGLADLLKEADAVSEEMFERLNFDDLAKSANIDIHAGEVDEGPEPQIDRAAELQAEWGTETGQIWLITGESGITHRLLCGDSTSEDDVKRLMGTAKCRLICTDPPYGVDFVGAKYCPTAKDWDGIKNDKRQGDDLREWLAGMWSIWLIFAYSDAAFYSWAAAMEEGAAAAAMKDAGIHVQSQIIWVKNQLVLGQADYQWKHENCWYGFLKGKKHRWLGGRSQTTVWNVDKVTNSQYLHPMQKPIELYARPIRNHTGEGDIVAEPFCGCGSQMLAADQLSRVCYAIELDPKFVAVTLDRMLQAGFKCEQSGLD